METWGFPPEFRFRIILKTTRVLIPPVARYLILSSPFFFAALALRMIRRCRFHKSSVSGPETAASLRDHFDSLLDHASRKLHLTADPTLLVKTSKPLYDVISKLGIWRRLCNAVKPSGSGHEAHGGRQKLTTGQNSWAFFVTGMPEVFPVLLLVDSHRILASLSPGDDHRPD